MFVLLLFWLLILIFLGLFALAIIAVSRRNSSQVAKELGIETRLVVKDGRHNAFTDLVFWQDYFYLVYCSSPSHFACRQSCIVVLRSRDTKAWEETARLKYDAIDIRDPKLATFRGTLFLFALLNKSFDPEPYQTVISHTSDGQAWTPFSIHQEEGWLFGRPKTIDGENWYVPAHWHEFNKVGLLKTADGENWVLVGNIIELEGVDETAIEFMPDGTMQALIRFAKGNVITGSPENGTLTLKSPPPYTGWSKPVIDNSVRMDSPNLLRLGEHMLAIGRSQPEVGKPFLNQGSALSRKRTSLFLIADEKIIHLSEFPSSGDTAYAGIAVRNDSLYISYYSSPINHDLPWLIGMLFPTGIYLGRLDQNKLSNFIELKGVG